MMDKDNQPEIIVNETGSGMEIFVPAIEGSSNVLHTSNEVIKPSSVNQKEQFASSLSKDFILWGTDNRYPTVARMKAEKNGIFSQNRFKKTCIVYGQGVEYLQQDGDELKPIKNKEIEDFLLASDLQQYFLQQAMNFYTYWITFLEYRMNRGSSQNQDNKIKAISALQPEWSRIGKQKAGTSKNLFYSPGFAFNGQYDQKNGKKMKLYFPSTKEDYLKTLGASRKFAASICFPTPGKAIYPSAPWHSLFLDDSWLDVALETPILIRALHKNMITLKYVIHIPMDFWRFQYPKWDNYDASKRKKHINEKAKEMNDFLAGSDKTGKSLIVHFGMDPATGKAFPGFTVESIKDYTKHDAYLPNSQAANAEICYSQGVNPSVIGLQTPGGKLGAGSGSDIRVATNVELMQQSAIEELLLKPIRFVHQWNEWPDDIVWKIKRTFITTLDDSPTGAKPMEEDGVD